MRLIITICLSAIGLLLVCNPTFAYTPPENIEVTIYRLTDIGTIWQHPVTNAPQLCSSGDDDYGCTEDGDYPYPYGNSNPVTIPIETDYLLDVISQEMGSFEFNDDARHAQAVAARTYAYFFDNAGLSLNNSTEHHVFIPYRFEIWEHETGQEINFSLNATEPCRTWSFNLLPEQQNICRAVGASQWYITDGVPSRFPADEFPAFTEYFADIPFQTLTNTTQINPPANTNLLYPHLVGVQEPISQPPVAQNGHGRGLSQLGASRWGYGNVGWRGDLDNWYFEFDTTEILVHYYSGIHLREQDESIVTPRYRWNPLDIDWGGAHTQNNFIRMAPNESRMIKITLQNTSVRDWTCGPFEYDLAYRWRTASDAPINIDYVDVCELSIGQSTPLDFTITAPSQEGPYRLRFDINQYDIPNDRTLLFSDPDNGWEDISYLVCVGDCFDNDAYLPLLGSPTREESGFFVPTAIEAISDIKVRQGNDMKLRLLMMTIFLSASTIWFLFMMRMRHTELR